MAKKGTVPFFLACTIVSIGCKPYRVEYHRRPAYWKEAAEGDVPDRVVLDDGTVIIYGDRNLESKLDPKDAEGKKVFQLREERDDGTVILQARAPADVLAITLQCLRDEEYDLLWEQIVAAWAKREYEAEGSGAEDFTAFCQRNRLELAASLSRMLLGLPRHEAYWENAGQGVVRCRFYPAVGKQFKFTTVDVVAEDGGMRLLSIR